MRSDEIAALGDLASEAIGGTATRVHDMHAGVAHRVFDAIGPGAAPVQLIHDRIARRVYSAVHGACGAAVRIGASAISETRSPDAPSIEHTTAGRVAVGALNGAFGDMLARRGSALATPMTLRRDGHDVATTENELRRAFGDVSPRLAVFLHGLCETEDAWRLGSETHAPYGTRLERELGYTPLFINYNSGRHISDNGRELARLLGDVVRVWPVEVGEIALIGHSMGGLVARSACHYGAGSEWVGKVRHVFMLGAPHRGAPLEQLAHAASSALATLPETRALANALNLRSAGIKDLRHGYLLDDDWLGRDPDAFVRNAAREIPFLATISHYFVCATLSWEPDAPIGRVVGDLLVLRPSAWAHGGPGERMRFPVEHYRHVGRANHFDLLNHPAIYDQIRSWLSGPKALPAPAAV